MKHYQGGGGLIEALISLVTSLHRRARDDRHAGRTSGRERREHACACRRGFLATSILGMAAANPENVGCYIVNTTQTVPCASPDAPGAGGGLDRQCVGPFFPGSASVSTHGGLRQRQRAASRSRCAGR